jgi:hypothetical protein
VSEVNAADALRTPTTSLQPDPRSPREAMGFTNRWEAISPLQLGPEVPEAIAIHFETAKNILLYAWFVYRFHMVAEQYVLSTLELALRERLLRDKLITVTENWTPGLNLMLVSVQPSHLVLC